MFSFIRTHTGQRLARIKTILAIRFKAEGGAIICSLAVPAGPPPKTDRLVNKQLAQNPGMPGDGVDTGTWTQLSGGSNLIRLLGAAP